MANQCELQDIEAGSIVLVTSKYGKSQEYEVTRVCNLGGRLTFTVQDADGEPYTIDPDETGKCGRQIGVARAELVIVG